MHVCRRGESRCPRHSERTCPKPRVYMVFQHSTHVVSSLDRALIRAWELPSQVLEQEAPRKGAGKINSRHTKSGLNRCESYLTGPSGQSRRVENAKKDRAKRCRLADGCL